MDHFSGIHKSHRVKDRKSNPHRLNWHTWTVLNLMIIRNYLNQLRSGINFMTLKVWTKTNMDRALLMKMCINNKDVNFNLSAFWISVTRSKIPSIRLCIPNWMKFNFPIILHKPLIPIKFHPRCRLLFQIHQSLRLLSWGIGIWQKSDGLNLVSMRVCCPPKNWFFPRNC